MSRYQNGSSGGADNWTNQIIAERRQHNHQRQVRSVSSQDGIIDNDYWRVLERNRKKKERAKKEKERFRKANYSDHNIPIDQRIDRLQNEVNTLQNELEHKQRELEKLQVEKSKQ